MKKVLALVLVLMMAFSAVAMAETVKIGVFEPLSGDSGAGGKQEMLGMQYANSLYPTVEIDGVTYDILYDILIKQNGDIHSDWTGVMMDVDAYEKVVFEPYDLKWLERV